MHSHCKHYMRAFLFSKELYVAKLCKALTMSNINDLDYWLISVMEIFFIMYANVREQSNIHRNSCEILILCKLLFDPFVCINIAWNRFLVWFHLYTMSLYFGGHRWVDWSGACPGSSSLAFQVVTVITPCLAVAMYSIKYTINSVYILAQ